MDILQISFDGLTYTQKELFLDIACFFKGENKDCIGDKPNYNLGVLMKHCGYMICYKKWVKKLFSVNPLESLVDEVGYGLMRMPFMY